MFLSSSDSWSELLPTLTRADADLPTLYFLGATDKLLVIGGNNSDNVVTSFCVDSQKWGQVRQTKRQRYKLFKMSTHFLVTQAHVTKPTNHRLDGGSSNEDEVEPEERSTLMKTSEQNTDIQVMNCVEGSNELISHVLSAGAQGGEGGVRRTGDGCRRAVADAERRT